MMKGNAMITQADVFRLVATSPFRKFVKLDYECFAGVESANPMISENDEFVLVLDGNVVSYFDYDGGNLMFILESVEA
jgi:predicted RNA-binding protein